METIEVFEVIEEVIICPEGVMPEVIELKECAGDLFIIKVKVLIKGIDHFIYQKILDDGMRYFRDPFREDAIDLEENTPLFNTIFDIMLLKEVSEHKSALYTPMVFDEILNKAYTAFIDSYAKKSKALPLSRYISYFGINEDDSQRIASLIARDEATQVEIDMLAQFIYLLSPHSLFNEPIENHYGEWKLIETEGKMNKNEFRKNLLNNYNDSEKGQKSLF